MWTERPDPRPAGADPHLHRDGSCGSALTPDGGPDYDDVGGNAMRISFTRVAVADVGAGSSGRHLLA